MPDPFAGGPGSPPPNPATYGEHYLSSVTPAHDPYASVSPAAHDPFAQSAPYSVPPAHDPYGGPSLPPPQHIASPPPPPQDYLSPQHTSTYPPGRAQDPFSTPGGAPMPGPSPGSTFTGYQLRDDEGHDDDAGDMPLLRRDNSGRGGGLGELGEFPGGFAPEMDADGDTNIRYGRIPQRVPRRYKTIKKVE